MYSSRALANDGGKITNAAQMLARKPSYERYGPPVTLAMHLILPQTGSTKRPC